MNVPEVGQYYKMYNFNCDKKIAFGDIYMGNPIMIITRPIKQKQQSLFVKKLNDIFQRIMKNIKSK